MDLEMQIKELQQLVCDLSAENLKLTKKLEKEEVVVDICDWLGRWIDDYRNRIRKNTYSTYWITVHKHLIPYFHDKGISIGSITAYDFEQYCYYKLECGLSAQTIKHHYATIRLALNCAVKSKFISENSLLDVRLPKIKEFKYTVLSFEQINILIKRLKDTYLFIPILLGGLLGMRRSEVVGLKWKCVDFDNKTICIKSVAIQYYDIDINKTVVDFVDDTKTNTSERVYHVPEKIMNLLLYEKSDQTRRQKQKHYNMSNVDYVCVKNDGSIIKPSYISRNFKKIISEIFPDKKSRFHDLRHSCGTFLYEEFGYNVKDIQTYLGHSSPAFTAKTYLHTTDIRKEKIAQSIEHAIEVI